MKKLLAFIGVSFGLMIIPFALNSKVTYVKAEEEIVETEPEPIIEEEPVDVPEEPTEAEDEESKFEEFKGFVTDKLNSLVGEDLATKIVTWLLDGGVLAACFTVCLKYNKFKHNSLESVVKTFKEEISVYLKESFKQLSDEEISKLVKAFDLVEEKTDLLMKALVLAQSKTNESKIAMLDLISGISKNDSVNSCIEETKTEIVKEQEVKKEIEEKVSGDFTPVD